MATRYFLIVCASACFFNIVSAQCIGSLNGIAAPGLAAEELALNNGLAIGAGLGAFRAGPLGYGAGPYGAAAGYGLNAAPTSGGGFAVTSVSPISPTGISVVSENAIEGPLSITGQLPFLGAIALDGALPTAGAGAINYGCGKGAVGMVSEGLAPAMVPAAYPVGPGYGAPAGLAGGMGYPGMGGPRAFNGMGGLGAGYGGIY